MKNLVLIGMPGCGKSTIGKILANKLNKKFIDTDTEIEIYTGLSIKDIFEKYGEEFFRKIESEIFKKNVENEDAVISSGGGIIKWDQNFKHLDKTKSLVVYIKRNIDDIAIDFSRPLVKSYKDLYRLYNERKYLYNKYSDYTINNVDIDTTIGQLIKYYKGWEKFVNSNFLGKGYEEIK